VNGLDPKRPPRLQLGRIVGGALLVLFGVLWLLEIAEVIDVSWRQVLAASLIVVGIALAWGARTDRHGGLITLGVVLTLATVFSGVVEIVLEQRFTGGVGDRVVTADDVDGRRLAIGSLTVDLRGANLSGDIEASVGIGELIVIVDDASVVTVEAKSGIGEVVVFGRSAGGFGQELRVAVDDAAYRLIVSVGIGKVEVRE
jgi:predicted membrane protein